MMDTSEAVTGASVSIDHYATARGDCDHCEAGLLGREVPACHTCWSILYIDRDRGSARVLAGSRDGLASSLSDSGFDVGWRGRFGEVKGLAALDGLQARLRGGIRVASGACFAGAGSLGGRVRRG